MECPKQMCPPWDEEAQTDSKENLVLSGHPNCRGESSLDWLQTGDKLAASQSSRVTKATQQLTQWTLEPDGLDLQGREQQVI